MTPLTISVRDAARAIGVTEQTVRAKIAAGELSAARVNRRVLVRMESLQQLIDRNTVAATGAK